MNGVPTPKTAIEVRAARLPYAALLCVVFLWGAGPVVTKLITVPPATGALLRFGISIPLLFAIVIATGRRISGPTMRAAAAPGAAFGINLVLVFAAVQEATVAVLVVAVSLQPAAILIIAGPMFGERASRSHVVWTIIAIAGASIVILGAGSELRTSPLGAVLSLTAVAMFTTYFVLTRAARLKTAVDPIEWMTAINVWAFVSVLPVALVVSDWSDLTTMQGRDWLWIIVLSYLTGVLGHVLMSWAHGYIEASRSSLSVLLMNIVAVSLAWPVHDEPVTWVQGIGGVIALGAVAMVLRIPPVART